MRTKTLLLWMTIGSMGMTACVSKKKFVEMESSKLRAEQRVRELTGENEAKATRIGQMIADFEKMKQELLESNAQKDQLITNLNGQINALNSNVKEKDATIEEKLYAFEYEKRRLEEELATGKSAQVALRAENESLSGELNQTKNQLSDLQFDLKRKKDEAERLEQQRLLKDKEYEAQEVQLSRLKAEIQQLKNQLQEKDETIERLNNNVNLLKRELGK
ncbi:hypothetical protein [Gaoshiqia sediminis]|uniref:Uncharacterized protein n=1 Tax=Gaoshiqia sediminis TaxID=2986998 RepID=A0AA41YB36_9BACT|nr:hypothetical protein [Gaoshiqia sediminis]MCW0484408.1 hypothetical protein [Gaoshiqia sediminis]